MTEKSTAAVAANPALPTGAGAELCVIVPGSGVSVAVRMSPETRDDDEACVTKRRARLWMVAAAVASWSLTGDRSLPVACSRKSLRAAGS